MYKGIGPPFKNFLERKNEWCEYDLKVLKQELMVGIIPSFIVMGIVCIVLIFLIHWNYKNLLCTFQSTIILIIFTIAFIYWIWRPQLNNLHPFKNSYCICLNVDDIDLDKTKDSIKKLLVKNKIQFEVRSNKLKNYDFQYNYQNSVSGRNLIEIWPKDEKEIYFFIITNEFKNMNRVNSLKDIIWREKTAD